MRENRCIASFWKDLPVWGGGLDVEVSIGNLNKRGSGERLRQL